MLSVSRLIVAMSSVCMPSFIVMSASMLIVAMVSIQSHHVNCLYADCC
jgi:hypothetical protein